MGVQDWLRPACEKHLIYIQAFLTEWESEIVSALHVKVILKVFLCVAIQYQTKASKQTAGKTENALVFRKGEILKR